MRIAVALAGVLVLALGANAASAKDVQVKMLNSGSAGGMMVFEPKVVKIAPGDTVTFVAADKGHNVESLAAMLPPGATAFKGAMNQTLTVKFAKPGVYGFKCAPHYMLGMVGAVIVGNGSANLQAAKAAANPARAKQVFAKILQ